MIINRVKLKNIRSYQSEEVEIPEGTVLLAGDIGAGKTTLLLAIEFALFGIQGVELSGEALLRHGANEGSVQLDFSMGEKQYTIVRTLKRKSGSVRQDTGYVVADGKTTEMTAVELKCFILNVLGYPEELLATKKSIIYRYTVYTPQEEMKRIITEDAEARLQTLRKIFNIDRYKLVRENSALVSRVLKQGIREVEKATEDLPELELEAKEYNVELAKSKTELEGVALRLSQIKLQLSESKGKLEALEKKREHFVQMQKQIGLFAERLSSADNLISRTRLSMKENKGRAEEIKASHDAIELPKDTLPLDAIRKGIHEKEALLQKLRKDEAELNAKLDGEVQSLSRLKNECELTKQRIDGLLLLKQRAEGLKGAGTSKMELQLAIKETRDSIEKTSQELSMLIARGNEDGLIASKLGAASECPLCKKPLTPEHRKSLAFEIEERRRTVEASRASHGKNQELLRARLSELEITLAATEIKEAELHKLEGQLSALDEAAKELSNKQKQLAECTKTIDELKDRISKRENTEANEKQLSSLREQERLLATLALRMEQKEQLKRDFARLKDESIRLKAEMEQLEKAKAEISLQLADVQKSAEGLSTIEGEYALAKKGFEGIQAEEREWSMQEASVQKGIEKVKEYLGNVEKRIKEKSEKRSKIAKDASLVNWLEDYFSPLTETIERHVMLSIYQEFNELFTTWFSMLIEDPQLQVRLDDEFTPVVVQNGYEASVSHLSGGERTSVALAYRLALNRVINDLTTTINTKDLIILDEPTDGFSSEQLDNVRKVIDELNIRQVIIVSHEAKIESFVDSVIYITKSDGLSCVQ